MRKLVVSLLLYIISVISVSGQSLEKINTGAVVKYPSVSLDGTRMVFVANYYGVSGLFVSYYDADSIVWKKPQPLLRNVTEGFEIRDPKFNFDNTKIYFAGKKPEKPDFDIYYSEKKDGSWSDPKLITVDIHTSQDELGPAFSPDGKKLLFIRPLPPEEKSEDFCGMLYYTEQTETGEWSEAELLPPAYNTGCLSSPYYTRDNNTFFFSSFEDIDDQEGKRIAKNQFSIMWAKISGFFRYNPVPVLSIIDKEDLVYPSFDNDSTLYFATGVYSKKEDKIESRVQKSILSKSLRPAEMTFASGFVKDENNQPLSATIQIINPYTTKIYQEVTSSANGYYQLFIPKDAQFSFLASKSGFSSQSKLIDTNEKYLEVDFELFPDVDVTFNVFDEEFYFPISNASIVLCNEKFEPINTIKLAQGESTNIALGKELNIIFRSENYFSDTLNLPFHEEVIFDVFAFDIELRRKLKDVNMTFTDDEGNTLGLEVTVFNVTRNEKTKRRVKDGKVSLQLRDGEVYEISTSAEGYSYYSESLDLSDKKTVTEVEAELNSVKNASLVLQNITFSYDSYELNAESYIELNKLVGYLSENSQYRVEISAHTDDAGAEKYNLKLSNLRASSVLQYLQDNSIQKDRLVSKGYGESNPIFPNDTDENRAKNRRVEFKILTE